MVERLEKSFVNASFNKYPCQFKFESIRSLKRRFLLCTNLRSGNPFLKHSGSFQFLCWPAFNYYCFFFCYLTPSKLLSTSKELSLAFLIIRDNLLTFLQISKPAKSITSQHLSCPLCLLTCRTATKALNSRLS